MTTPILRDIKISLLTLITICTVKVFGRLGTMRGGKDKHDEISSPQVYTRSKDNWRRQGQA